MSILRREPVYRGGLNTLFDTNSIFNDFFYPVRSQQDESSDLAAPRIDIEDQDGSFLVTADLPGVSKDDIEVSIKDGILTIRATTKKEQSEEKDGKIIRRERHCGEYLRRMTIGNDVAQNDVSAEFTDGVLKLTIPKLEPEAPKTHRISVN